MKKIIIACLLTIFYFYARVCATTIEKSKNNRPKCVIQLQDSPAAINQGVEKIMRLSRPRIVVFGGSNVELKYQNYYQKAHDLAQKLVQHNSSIITGGGPGIMEAGNCGALFSQKNMVKSFGVSVVGLSLNACLEDYIVMPDLYSRLKLLTYYADGFVIFPGGYGTAQEIFSILTLMKIKQIDQVPIVLFGKEYWKDLIKWIDYASQEKFIPQQVANLIQLTDDVDQAVDMLIGEHL